MKSILHFSIFLLVTVNQMQPGFAAPQSGDTTNAIQLDRERQAISIGPFIVGGDGKNTQTEQISNWAEEWLIPIAKIAAWPLVIIFIVLRFDKDIRRILENLKSIKGKEYSLEMSERLSDQKKQGSGSTMAPGTTPISTEVEFEKAKAAAKITPALEEIARSIKDNLKRSTFTPEQNVELGVLALSRVVLIAEFWRIYNFIFGSQLTLLQQVNARPLKEAEMVIHFSGVQKQFPEIFGKDSSADTYVSFLLANVLLLKKDGNYEITNKGKEFLIWCVENNLSFNKPF